MLNEYKNATTSCIFIQTRKIAVIARVFGRFPLKKGRGNAYCTTIMQPILYIKRKEKASTFFKSLPHEKGPPCNMHVVLSSFKALLSSHQLLKSNLCSNFLKLSLDVISCSLVSLLLNNLRSVVNNILSFLKSKTGYLTNNLDNLNLVWSNLC